MLLTKLFLDNGTYINSINEYYKFYMLHHTIKILTLFQKIPTFYLNICKNLPKNDNYENIISKNFKLLMKYTLKTKIVHKYS